MSISTVPDALAAKFSPRSRHIDTAADALIDAIPEPARPLSRPCDDDGASRAGDAHHAAREGAFSLLVHSRTDAPELVDVHRFRHEWERKASLGLRQGDLEAIDYHIAHARSGGTAESMADAAYAAWRADSQAGRATVLISDSNEAVASLNGRAHTELILKGRVNAVREVALHE